MKKKNASRDSSKIHQGRGESSLVTPLPTAPWKKGAPRALCSPEELDLATHLLTQEHQGVPVAQDALDRYLVLTWRRQPDSPWKRRVVDGLQARGVAI